ncbi:MAG TPA: DcaP family trimeric outer membrane transporter [Gammaproteobacteria bacterium]|nr:DcaP family trimeric outer membrane transporter [Gammaproteobacteria bacterium]
MRTVTAATAVFATALAGIAAPVHAQDAKSFEVYGFAQTDYIQDFKRVDPAWHDSLRPSKIPTTDGQFGSDGQAILSIKQSRFGVRGSAPTGDDTLKFQFEFDLYGVGVDAGQTTMRVRHVYGSWGNWLAGQTNTLFMDIDIFPNTIDYWGPNGMVFLRNPQIRWTPVHSGDNTFAVAIEEPSNDIDAGQFREVDPALATFQANNEFPDITAQYKMNQSWGHLQIAGILRKLGVENIANPANIVKRDDTGWGVDVTASIKVGSRDKVLLGVVTGAGIATYMNDGGVDMAPTTAVAATADAQAVDLTGISAYFDHYWNSKWSSSIGYSYDEVDNLNGQTGNAFKKGEYFSANILNTPAENILIGAEILWGTREDFNGNTGDDSRIQFSLKYNFGAKL